MDERLAGGQRDQDLAAPGDALGIPSQHAEMVAVADRGDRGAGLASALDQPVERGERDDRAEPLPAIHLQQRRARPAGEPRRGRVGQPLGDALDHAGQTQQPVRGDAAQLRLQEQGNLLVRECLRRPDIAERAHSHLQNLG